MKQRIIPFFLALLVMINVAYATSVTVTYPNGGELINPTGTANDINFTISDDINVANIYISKSAGDKTYWVGKSLATSAICTATSCSWDWNVLDGNEFSDVRAGLIFGAHFNDSNASVEAVDIQEFDATVSYDFNSDGYYSSALDLNGSQCVAWENNQATANNIDVNQGTMCMWLRRRGPNNTSSYEYWFTSVISGQAYDNVYLRKYVNVADNLQFIIVSAADAGDNITCENSAAWNADDGLWHFVCATWDRDAATGCEIYVDKVRVANAAGISPSGKGQPNRLVLGGLWDTASCSNQAPGLIDEFMVFNSVLSSADINALYAGRPSSNNFYYTDINVTNSATGVTAQDGSFDDWYLGGAALQITITDESSGVNFCPQTITIDGNSWATSCSVGVLDLNVETGQLSTDANRTLIMDDVNYGSRSWIIATGSTTATSLDAIMLPDTLGQDVNFSFFKTDQLTRLANARLTVRLEKDTNTAYIIDTKADGSIQLFLNATDENYSFALTDSTGTDYNYNMVLLTIQTPRDADTNAALQMDENTGKFDIDIRNLGANDIDDVNTAQTFYILPEVAQNNPYKITVDYNSSAAYYPSTYSITTKGGVSTYSLTPYLTAKSVSTEISIHVLNSVTQNSIENVVIQATRFLTGEEVIVESDITDSTGTAELSLITGETYTLRFIYFGTTIATSTFVPDGTNTEYFRYLDLSEISVPVQKQEIINISFLPAGGNLIATDTNTFDVNVVISAQQNTITRINIEVDNNGVTVSDVNYTSGVSAGGTYATNIDISDLNISFPIEVKVTVISDANTTYSSKTYFVKERADAGFLIAINDLGIHLGDIGRLVLVIITTMIIVGGVASVGVGNNDVLFVIGLSWIGAFVALGMNDGFVEWVPFNLFIFGAVISFVIYAFSYRGRF